MIINKPGSVKINSTIHKLRPGHPAPAEVVEFWKKSGSIEELKKIGVITDGASSAPKVDAEFKAESKPDYESRKK
jgi:hypothetical protein